MTDATDIDIESLRLTDEFIERGWRTRKIVARVSLRPLEVDHAYEVGNGREERNRKEARTTNIDSRHLENQTEGAGGELSVCKHLGVYWHAAFERNERDADDCEVKWIRNPYNDNMLVERHQVTERKRYVLTSGRLERAAFIIIGWLPGKVILSHRLRTCWDPGKDNGGFREKPCFDIPQALLYNDPLLRLPEQYVR